MTTMELRTNQLFNNYLQEKVLVTTPSPEPHVTKYRDSLQHMQNNALNKSISTLCTMMEKCQIQLQTSNEIVSKLISPDSEYIVIQKTQLKEFFDQFRLEFYELRNDLKSGVIASNSNTTVTKSLHPSQKSIFNQEPIDYPKKSSQTSIFDKPLTPPSSFEKLLEHNKFDTFGGGLGLKENSFPEVSEEKPVIRQPRPKNGSSETPMQLTYKIRKKGPDCKKKRPKLSPKSSLSTVTSSNLTKMQNTQNWLESLPLPPKKENKKPSLNKLLTTTIGRKDRDETRDQDMDSIGKFSCRSIRTYKSSRKRARGANFVRVERTAKSEVGWGNCDEQFGFERHFRSEY